MVYYCFPYGFQQTTRYTCVIDALTDLDHLWSKFQENIRREIRKASKRLWMHSEYGIDNFLNVDELTFARQGLPLPYSREFARRLDDTCSARSTRKIFFAEDNGGRVHAAAYIVWGKRSAYYLMGVGDPELRTSGATSLVLWEAIKFFHQVSSRVASTSRVWLSSRSNAFSEHLGRVKYLTST